MAYNHVAPRIALNKAYLKIKPNRSDIEKFKSSLIELLDQINEKESEEFHKNIISRFLDKTYYSGNFYINTKGRNDLVVHTGKDAKSPVGVIIETKKPTNKGEMVQKDKLNSKAFHELVLYYMRERVAGNNLEIKYLIITNIYEWFVFDVDIFEKAFAQNKSFEKQFIDFEDKRLAGKNTDFFYKEIAEPAVADLLSGKSKVGKEFCYTHFDIRDYEKIVRNANKEDDNKLIALFKLLSPEHLLKLPFRNDSNSLDKTFYSELLHIIGLTEVKDGGKKLIDRKKEKDRDEGSILENTISQLESLDKLSRLDRPMQYGTTNKERYFNVGLELSITWINRILFLKLLEAQLLTYHKADEAYSFLNKNKIKSFDDLNSLFFQVLARESGERNAAVKAAFKNVPYLNSSLFEPSELEQICFPLSQLQDSAMLPILSNTVLKDNNGKRRTGSLNALDYLFSFLDAYDFSSEGSEEIQEENKALISASVLGLIFEKINGYKDGSFFTPGFITMYMCRETIRRAVLQKFNEAKGWNCESIIDLHNKINDAKEANNIINSLKICDPAVGSGHFLVSALNELIALKSELGILIDSDGKSLRYYHVEVTNDELTITDEDNRLFDYNPHNKESQRVQETLFREKQTLIENCLFGVDLNPNSVKICRLRLWIELLKNAYYKPNTNFTELETLPNIDINIKCGNSLISRFPLDVDLSHALKKSKITIKSYKQAVQNYRDAKNKDQKREMDQLISSIKSSFRTEISNNDPKVRRLSSKRGDLEKIVNQHSLFELSKTEIKQKDKIEKDLKYEVDKLSREIEEIRSNKVYQDAFEWRFEFPEILSDNGNYVGFDIIIGNPPYMSLQKLKDEHIAYEQLKYKTFSKQSDVYCLFYERGVELLKPFGHLTYISSNSWMQTQYGLLLRKFFVANTDPVLLLNIEDSQIFEEATVEANILSVKKDTWSKNLIASTLDKKFDSSHITLHEYFQSNSIVIADLPESGWSIGDEKTRSIKAKIETNSSLLGNLKNDIYRGFTTGFNEAFFISSATRSILISEDPNCEGLIKPALRGKDLSRYSYHWKDIWIILVKQGWTNKNRGNQDPEEFFKNSFPSIYNFLKSTGEIIKGKGKGLFNRDDMGDYWWELRPCIYYDDFEKEKIIWGELSDDQKFSLDASGYYANNTVFFLTGENIKYLLGILNSKLAKWYFNIISTSSGMGTNRWLKYKIEQLPIKNASNVDLEKISDLVTQIEENKRNNLLHHSKLLEEEIDKLVFYIYDLDTDDIEFICSELEK
jgi:hypothetical protein